MSPRLLSFLTDVESSLRSEEPSPRGGTWENVRSINYHHGLARLILGARRDPATLEPLGAVMLQFFKLADGTVCLKAFLSWPGGQTEAVRAIYARPDSDWAAEARRVSTAWLASRPKAGAVTTPVSVTAGSSLERLAATG